VPALDGLVLSAGLLVPPFHPDTVSYTVGPSVLPSQVTVTLQTSMVGGTLMVNGMPVAPGAASGPITLAMGLTPIQIVLTPPAGGTPRTYQVAVDRTSAALAGLTLGVGALTPSFDAATLAYGASAGVGAASTTITPTALDSNAAIHVNTLPTPSGAASAPVNLGSGLTPITIDVTARDGTTVTTYVVSVTRGLAGAEAYLKASNTGGDDWFGHRVALSGETLVVNALLEDAPAAANCGAIYVFVRNGTTWMQQAFLRASNAGAGDQFGSSLAISGDTIVVGSIGESSVATGVNGDETSNAAAGSGAAYVFVRSGTVWTQQAYLKASNTQNGDLFGWSADIDGDTIVVGARGESSSATGVDGDGSNNSASASGAAYVFVRSASNWAQQAYLKASNTDSVDYFGWSVAVSGDTVAVSAINEASPATGVDGGMQEQNTRSQAGAAYVFHRSTGTWTQQAFVKATNTDGGNNFGWSLSLETDTLVVGAVYERSGSTGVNGSQDQFVNPRPNSGAAYVYTRSGSTWSPSAYLKASNTGSDDLFGHCVAISGGTIVVGSLEEASSATGIGGNQADNGASRSGAAYVFVGSGSSWTQSAYVKATNTEAVDAFGYFLDVSGDTIVVGAYSEDSGATGVGGNQLDNSALESGAVYVYR
jgi:hypothetical protein